MLVFYTSSNELTRMLSYDIVFGSMYAYSRSCWTSLKRLNKLVQTRGVWPISPVRTLRLLCGKRCEFCLNQENATSPYSSQTDTNPIPRLIRPGWPVFCCWPCLSERRIYQVSNPKVGWPGVSIRNITRQWAKLFYHPEHDKFYHKQFYLAHREILFRIFNHPRILAYPNGFRHHDIETGQPLSERGSNSTCSRDEYEIMWNTPLVKGGECIGGLMSADLIQPLVEYLKSPNNLGIDHFLLNMIPNAPSLEDYSPFLEAFEAIRLKAEFHEQHQDVSIRTKNDLARYHKIENAIESLFLVESTITSTLVDASCAAYSSELWNIRDFQRIILCYQEEHNLSLRHPLTWDTGDVRLNRALTDLFAPLLRAPTRVDINDLEEYATSFLSICIDHLNRSNEWENNAVFDEHGQRRTTFGVNYRLLINPRGWRIRRRPRSVTREFTGFENIRSL